MNDQPKYTGLAVPPEVEITSISPHLKMLTDFKETAGSRFNAAKRLRYLDRSLALLMAFTSGYLIWMNIWPAVRPLCPAALEWTSLFSSGLSILLLCVSLLVYAGNYSGNADTFNQCAMELNELYQRYRIDHVKKDDAIYLDYLNRYHAILKSYPVNHEMVDHLRYRFTYGFQHMHWTSRIWNRARIFLSYAYAIIILVAVTFAVGGLVLMIEVFSDQATCRHQANLHLSLDLPQSALLAAPSLVGRT